MWTVLSLTVLLTVGSAGQFRDLPRDLVSVTLGYIQPNDWASLMHTTRHWSKNIKKALKSVMRGSVQYMDDPSAFSSALSGLLSQPGWNGLLYGRGIAVLIGSHFDDNAQKNDNLRCQIETTERKVLHAAHSWEFTDSSHGGDSFVQSFYNAGKCSFFSYKMSEPFSLMSDRSVMTMSMMSDTRGVIYDGDMFHHISVENGETEMLDSFKSPMKLISTWAAHYDSASESTKVVMISIDKKTYETVICHWDSNDPTEWTIINTHERGMCQHALSSDGSLLALLAPGHSTIQVINADTGQLVSQSVGNFWFRNLKFSPDNSYIAMTDDSSCLVYRLRTQELLRTEVDGDCDLEWLTDELFIVQPWDWYGTEKSRIRSVKQPLTDVQLICEDNVDPSEMLSDPKTRVLGPGTVIHDGNVIRLNFKMIQ